MSKKHSIASKQRWANVPAEERSRRMRALAQKRMQALTPEERAKIARKLVRARKKK
jgi:hypothetical protein